MGIDIKEYMTPPVLLILFLLVISLMIVFPVLNMIILGAILAYGVRPVARKIQSKLKFSSISILLAMVVILIPLILLIAYIVIEVTGILTGFLATNSNVGATTAVSSLSQYLPGDLDINSISATIYSSLREIGTYLLNYLVKFASSLMNITVDLFILVCSVFYFVLDGDKCLEFIKAFVPDESKDFFDRTV